MSTCTELACSQYPVTPGRGGAACTADGLLSISGVLLGTDGIVHLQEGQDADLVPILRALRSAKYGKPFVVEDGTTRRLHFDLQAVQSEMLLAAPNELALAYTRKMMAALLFRPRPKNILIIGLGGGSLTKFCHQNLSKSRITTIEIDRRVIAFSSLFSVPTRARRVRLIHADAAQYIRLLEQKPDLVLIDACDSRGTAASFQRPDFYADLRANMHPEGVLAINAVGPNFRDYSVLQSVRTVFDGRCIEVDVSDGTNRIILAFNKPDQLLHWHTVRRRATRLQGQHGLDYPMFARKIRRRAARWGQA